MQTLKSYTLFDKKINPYTFLKDPKFLAVLWLGIVFVFYFGKIHMGIDNNYSIFVRSIEHALSGQPLYIGYPAEYQDSFSYGPSFTALIAPFALLPHILGALLWCIANSLLLYIAIRQLTPERRKFAFIICISLTGLFPAVLGHPYTIGITGMTILSFALIEKKKEFWAALPLMLGMMTDFCGIAGLAFFLFSKRRLHLLSGLLFWGCILFIVPMLYTSPQYIITAYGDWFQTSVYRNGADMFFSSADISLPGMIRNINHTAAYSNWWIFIPGLVLFIASYFRLNQYENKSFRLSFLASALLFMVLFSTGSGGYGYIGAVVATAIWYTSTPTRKITPVINIILLISCLIITILPTTNILPSRFRDEYITIYSLQALPCVLIWLKIIWEQLTQDFSVSRIPLSSRKISTIDIILPCYNPHDGWEQLIIDKHDELEKTLNIDIHIIVVNDGSPRGFTSESIQKLETALPDITIVNNKENKGKGGAVRDGLARSHSDVALYTDYDFPYEISSIYDVIKLLEQGYDVVIGNRNHTYYSSLTFKRKVISHASSLLNFILLGLTHTDTQGGLKGFSKKGKAHLESTLINHFLFDTEFIYKASQDSEVRIVETDVMLRDNVILPNIKKNVLKKELKNLLVLAWKG